MQVTEMVVKCVFCKHKMKGIFLDQPFCEKCFNVCILERVEAEADNVKRVVRQTKSGTKITDKGIKK